MKLLWIHLQLQYAQAKKSALESLLKLITPQDEDLITVGELIDFTEWYHLNLVKALNRGDSISIFSRNDVYEEYLKYLTYRKELYQK